MSECSLKQNTEEFIRYKQSIGYLYEGQRYLLNRYVTFVESRTTSVIPEKTSTIEFLSSLQEHPGTLYGAVAVLREFSRYLVSRGFYEAYVVPPKIASQPVAEVPYFFTQKEIDAFFEKLDKVKPNPSFKGRDIVLPVIFRLVYCCGLRCKEVRTLLTTNVNAEEHYIDVIQSKGPKSRRIFISQELSEYLIKYEKRISQLFPNRKYYFPGENGKHCSENFICGNFKRFWLEAFPDFEKRHTPRAYDFRHHFAWANLNRWASEGLDVNAMLPYLMRYMGHQTVSETLYYFHFIPEFFPTYKEMTSTLEDAIPEVPDEE